MTWRAAKSLIVFQNQVRPFAAGADPRSFGLKGDDQHDSTSDHAPHDFPGWGQDIVTAADIPRFGNLHPRQVLDNIRKSKDPRVKYGISEGQMFSSYAAHGIAPWTWRDYSGKDGHFDHGHLSVVGDKRADDERPWQIGAAEEADELSEAADTIKYELRPWLADAAHAVGRIEAQMAALTKTVDVLAAALRTGGGDLDTAAIIGRINEVARLESSTVLDLQQQLRDRDQRLAEALQGK